MTCSKADTHVIGKLRTILALLSDSALATVFYIYVRASKFYMQEFWNVSYVGRFLVYVKIKICAYQSSHHSLETHGQTYS